VDKELSCTKRAIGAIIDLGIPTSRYEALVRPPIVVHNQESFYVPTIAAVKIPSFWASTKKLKKEWARMKQEFEISQVAAGVNGYAWSPLACLQFIMKKEQYSKYIDTPLDLEVIVRGDGLPVGGSHASFLLLTLGNFGKLGKCLSFNFIIALAEVNEKNQDGIRSSFASTMDQLNRWSRDGYVEVFSDLVCKVRVEYGGDESWLRMMLGFKSASENLACIKCLWQRGTQYNEDERCERIVQSLGAFMARGTLDQVNPPLITEGAMYQIHHCGMHAIIPFGKDLCQLILDHLLRIEESGNSRMLEAASWMHRHHINVDVTYL
jgi:hypothetical protein